MTIQSRQPPNPSLPRKSSILQTPSKPMVTPHTPKSCPLPHEGIQTDDAVQWSVEEAADLWHCHQEVEEGPHPSLGGWARPAWVEAASAGLEEGPCPAPGGEGPRPAPGGEGPRPAPGAGGRGAGAGGPGRQALGKERRLSDPGPVQMERLLHSAQHNTQAMGLCSAAGQWWWHNELKHEETYFPGIMVRLSAHRAIGSVFTVKCILYRVHHQHKEQE